MAASNLRLQLNWHRTDTFDLACAFLTSLPALPAMPLSPSCLEGPWLDMTWHITHRIKPPTREPIPVCIKTSIALWRFINMYCIWMQRLWLCLCVLVCVCLYVPINWGALISSVGCKLDSIYRPGEWSSPAQQPCDGIGIYLYNRPFSIEFSEDFLFCWEKLCNGIFNNFDLIS